MFNRLLKTLLLGTAFAFIVLGICAWINFDYSDFMMIYSALFIIITLRSLIKNRHREKKHIFLVSSYILISFSIPLYLIWFIFP